MDDDGVAGLIQQFLLDQVHMGDLGHLLLNVAVVFDIDAALGDHGRNGFGVVGVGLGHGQADVGPFHKKKPPSGLRIFYNSIVPDSAVGCKHLQRFCVLMWDVLYLFYKKHGGHHPGRRNR